MKKILLAITLMLPLASLQAGDRSFKDWLKDLDAKLRRVEDKRRNQLTAAASVRGAKQDEGGKLYWKGRKKSQAVSVEELDAFRRAVDLAQAGKSAEAQEGLEALLTAHPGSPLEEDARKTLALLKDAPADAAPAAEAPKP